MLAKAGLRNPVFFWHIFTLFYFILLHFTLLHFILHNFTLGIDRDDQVKIGGRFVYRNVPLKPTSSVSSGRKPTNDRSLFSGKDVYKFR